MKHLLILFFIILTFTGNLFSQAARIVDLKLNVLEPKQMTPIVSPANINFKFSMLNKGPSSIHIGDSLDCIFFSSSMNYTRKRVAFTKAIALGDSEVFNISVPLMDTQFQPYFSVVVRIYPFNFGADSLRTETLEMQQDNRQVIRLPLTVLSVNTTFKENWKISPNPAIGSITIQPPAGTNIDECRYSITDISGKSIHSGLVHPATPTLVNVEQFSSGIYFLNIKNGNGSFNSKIVIQR